MSIPRSVIN